MESIDELVKALKSADNEATDAPYWLIVDPRTEGRDSALMGEDWTPHDVINYIVNCITGPFFSRKDAQEHLESRRYAFTDKATVYCHSGHWSRKYKAFCREIEVGR